ncbi:hypothetical protein [Anaplasma platys]|uniref:hypothetical protein n=1 Tax=Anaplasma platys TaxID=949 RepID=UPI00145F818B|nr:hypothetical protein [Anaplasma platys]
MLCIAGRSAENLEKFENKNNGNGFAAKDYLVSDLNVDRVLANLAKQLSCACFYQTGEPRTMWRSLIFPLRKIEILLNRLWVIEVVER